MSNIDVSCLYFSKCYNKAKSKCPFKAAKNSVIDSVQPQAPSMDNKMLPVMVALNF